MISIFLITFLIIGNYLFLTVLWALWLPVWRIQYITTNLAN